MVVVDLAAEELFHRADDALGAHDGAVDGVFGQGVDDGQLGVAALAVGADELLLHEVAVDAADLGDQLDFFGAE